MMGTSQDLENIVKEIKDNKLIKEMYKCKKKGNKQKL